MMFVDNNRGFTLLELMFALVIFAVGILGVNAMQLSAISGNSKSRMISEASSVGADIVEQIQSLAYDDAMLDDDDGDGTGHDVNNDGIDDVPGNNFGLDDLVNPDQTVASGNYQISWNVAIDYPVVNSKMIRVRVDSPADRAATVIMDYVKYDAI